MNHSAENTGAPILGLAGRIARLFAGSKLTPLAVIAAMLLGVLAVERLPREEEPQIKVPMVDVFVTMPGATAAEVESRVTSPMEKLLWEIPGVEYVYSTSSPGESLVIVRFKVGEDVEKSIVKLNQKLQTNFDRIPHGVSTPMVKPRSIDDVPILALTFHSRTQDALTLRRLAAQAETALKPIPDVAETTLIGGARRQVRVLLDPARLAARNLSPAGLIPMLQTANRQFPAGSLTTGGREIVVETGAFLTDAREVGNVVVGVHAGRPVHLREVAEVEDGPEEPTQYVFFTGRDGVTEPAVTLTFAKRPGANAVTVAGDVLRKLDTLRGTLIPADVTVTVTRNYGETAKEKSDELLFHMLLAVAGVSLLILIALGFRAALVVAMAIPATLALTLLVFLLGGYTLNRITLFALIFSIGILVDDAIVVVENIARHLRLPENRGRPLPAGAAEAVDEVGPPTMLATWAVIAAILPMAAVGGLMGPYMRPIPVGASAAMLFSLAVAFAVTPWAAVRLLRPRPASGSASSSPNSQLTTHNPTCPSPRTRTHNPQPVLPTDHGPQTTGPEDFLTRLYRHVMGPLLSHAGWRNAFLAGIVLLLAAAAALVPLGVVQVKMLPFDNKSEFQVVLTLPDGSPLEETARAAREIAAALRAEPEVANCQIYTGVAAPFNFNGLVRHYYLRRGANVADLQVNLLPKSERRAQSHAIAKRVRPAVAAIAAKYGARVAMAEVPPGPPVLQTLVAECYGPTPETRLGLARAVRDLFRRTPGVVDVDWYVKDDQPRTRFVIDKEKAALHGISAETISQTLKLAVGGVSADLLHQPGEQEDVNLVLQLPRSLRARPDDLLSLRVRAGDANALPEPGAGEAGPTAPPLVPLRELVRTETDTAEKDIYHKNLMPVVYVTGDVAGAVESPAYAILAMNRELRKLDTRPFGGGGARLAVWNAHLPFTDAAPALKWDGEWQITLEVFRDLGLAFAAVLVLIYLLMVGWFRSFLTPVIVMVAIPFSLVGILPAHAALGAFFSATSMIGFMAGAGIVVRNSIILVDFIELRLAQGMPVKQAVVDAGAVRFRPMLLTALAVIVGATVILFDPIFQGLALSLMAGEVASLLISRMAVPVLYHLAHTRAGTVMNA